MEALFKIGGMMQVKLGEDRLGRAKCISLWAMHQDKQSTTSSYSSSPDFSSESFSGGREENHRFRLIGLASYLLATTTKKLLRKQDMVQAKMQASISILKRVWICKETFWDFKEAQLWQALKVGSSQSRKCQDKNFLPHALAEGLANPRQSQWISHIWNFSFLSQRQQPQSRISQAVLTF